MKTRLALVLGDPAGIGPELVAKLLGDRGNLDKASVLLIADRAEVEEGMRIAGRKFDYSVTDRQPERLAGDGVVLWDVRGSPAGPFERAKATADGGAYCLDTLRKAIELTVSGVTDGVMFAPLNKSSMHQAGLKHEDESQWFASLLGVAGPHGELNVLDDLWTSRVTSHVALKDVAGLITRERVIDGIALVHSTLVASGTAAPRIAVCGLNPHKGIRRGRDHVSRPGPDRDEADGVLARRHRPWRLAHSDHDARSRYGLRHIRPRRRQCRRHAGGIRHLRGHVLRAPPQAGCRLNPSTPIRDLK